MPKPITQADPATSTANLFFVSPLAQQALQALRKPDIVPVTSIADHLEHGTDAKADAFYPFYWTLSRPPCRVCRNSI